MSFKLNIIGAGNLGKTIGYLLVKNNWVQIGSICNQSEKSSNRAIKFIGTGKYCSKIADLPAADITLIATPDDLIAKVSGELSKNPLLKPGSIIFHCSGSLTSEELVAVQNMGCYVASIHSMRSFAQPELSVSQYVGTYCAIEGDVEAVSVMNHLFNAIGSITYSIDKNKKILYHAAGVFASNYVITLAEQALTCLLEAGIEKEIAMKVITNLMQSAVSNLEKTSSPGQSLTGPIKRGDIATIIKHMDSLPGQQKKLYSCLGKASLQITTLDEVKKTKISRVLL